MRLRSRQTLLVILIVWVALAGYILGRFANNAFPTYYLFRPLLWAIPFAVIIGLFAAWRFPSQAPLVGAGIAGAISVFSIWTRFWPPLAAVLVVWLVVWLVARQRGWQLPSVPRAASTVATVFVLVFFVSGAVRAFMTLEAPLEPVVVSGTPTGPNVYLVLLDGYPRSDTLLTDMGIDNEPFQQALEARGFDVYRDATSDRRYTDYTLLALLNGSTEGVPPDTDLTQEGQWDLRRQLSDAPLPREAMEAGYEYWVIDSPAGFVTFTEGNHIQKGGINTLEEHMLASSALAPAVKMLWPTLPTDSLRDHFTGGVDNLVSLADPDKHRLVLAHLFQPHLPFQWDLAGNPLGVPDFWPKLGLFVWQIEHVDMPVTEYASLMEGELATLNPRLLDMVDEILARDPNGVIVLFSDHGSRYSLELQDSEWYHSFLAARTPDHPGLFASDPTTTNLLRTLLPTYIAP